MKIKQGDYVIATDEGDRLYYVYDKPSTDRIGVEVVVGDYTAYEAEASGFRKATKKLIRGIYSKNKKRIERRYKKEIGNLKDEMTVILKAIKKRHEKV